MPGCIGAEMASQAAQLREISGPTPRTYRGRLERARSGNASSGELVDAGWADQFDFEERKLVPEGGTLRSRYIGAEMCARCSSTHSYSIWVYIRIYIYVYMYSCARVTSAQRCAIATVVHIRIYIYIYIYMYIRIYTYIYI